jgi:hypothetical protein
MKFFTGTATIFILFSTVMLPWIFTSIIALFLASLEPLIPFAIGIIFDILYFAPGSSAFPLFTLCGLVATGVAFFVRERLRASIIR